MVSEAKTEDASSPVCNICGAKLARIPVPSADRESADCDVCQSSIRLRSIIALLSEELFGMPLTLPEFPVLKEIRAIGMSDPLDLAQRLSEKFDYTNTFYHQAPSFDATRLRDEDRGHYDLILSSEVMEHVPPPIELAFRNLYDALKPDGLLLMSTPFSLGKPHAEHFPELREFTLAAPGGKLALINRRADGSTEVFDDLVFHGGPGSTLEMRLFNEESLRAAIQAGGFSDVHFECTQNPHFGVIYAGPWSLPIAARKGRLRAPLAELMRQNRELAAKLEASERNLEIMTAEYQRHSAFHDLAGKEWEAGMAAHAKWAHESEANFQERARWAEELNRENAELRAMLGVPWWKRIARRLFK